MCQGSISISRNQISSSNSNSVRRKRVSPGIGKDSYKVH